MWQIVLSGPGYLDTEYELSEGETHLGRAEENDVVLSGHRVSRRHARLEVGPGGVRLRDEGSRNGTRVNGARIDGPRELVAGDVIVIGENRILLRSATPLLARPAPEEPRLREITDRFPPPAATSVLLRRSVEEPGALAGIEKARSLGPNRVLDEGAPEVSSLILLYQLSERLAKAPSLTAFLEEVVELVLELARARAVVAILGGPGAEPAVVRQRGGGGSVPLSRGAVEECLRSRVALCIADAGSDARFADRDSVLLHGITQVICVPLFEEDEVAGALYVTRDADEVDLPRLVEALVAIAHLAASGIRQQRLRERAGEEARVRRALERFHAPDIVDRVVRDLGRGSAPRMEERDATILFADISGFTPLTERLPAERIVALLDEFYRRMTAVVFSFGGTVDKFIGDAVMAIFGAPFARGDDAARAVRAALSMQAEFAAMMRSRPAAEQAGLKIGLASGRVLAGTVGGDRLEYTAVGDAVNVAARLTSTASAGEVLVTSVTLEQLGDRFRTVALGERALRGRVEKVSVFAVDAEVDATVRAAAPPGEEP